MIGNYLKVVLRNVRRRPVYTLINIFGLGIGIACCFLIFLYVTDELSYDKHFQQSDRLYRVNQSIIFEGEENPVATTPFPLKEALIRDFPALVSSGVRFFNLDKDNISVANPENREIIRQERFYFTDPDVVDLFDIEIVAGNPQGGLDDPNSVIISERVASLYFGDEDPVGKDLRVEGRFLLNVSAVMKEWKDNTHFKSDMLASFESLRGIWGNFDVLTARWRWNPSWTYILLQEGADAANLQSQLDAFSERYYSDFFSEQEQVKLYLQPIEDIWLYSNLEAEIEPTSSYVNIYLFSVIAVLILLIACVNFINLSTAGAIYRSKEVGIRKVLGAEKSGLVTQFMIESILFTLISLVLAAGIIYAALPHFSAFTGKELLVGNLGTGSLVLFSGILLVSIAALSGLYPSAVLTSLKPIDSLRGKLSKGKDGAKLRKGLVVFQFSITAFLIIATALTYFQFNYLQQKNLGFDKEQVLVVPMGMTSAIWSLDQFIDRSSSHNSVLGVTGSSTLLGGSNYWKYDITPEGYAEGDAPSLTKLFVWYDFVETMKINLLAGRSFSKEFSTDETQAVLINRAMVDFLEWGTPEDAIGKTFRIADNTMSVVGVTEDFNHSYLRRELEPLIMELPSNLNQKVANLAYLNIRLAPGNPSDATAHLEEVWGEVDRSHGFDYFFLDDRLNQIYRSEQQLTQILSVFSILAILIGCLGLMGLTAYAVNRRSREIAIRKTLGLSVPGVFALLSKDYMKLIVIAHIIALPVAYLVLNTWFGEFPFQINLNIYLAGMFVVSLLISMVISMLTISSQSLKAARINPAESLRSE